MANQLLVNAVATGVGSGMSPMSDAANSAHTVYATFGTSPGFTALTIALEGRLAFQTDGVPATGYVALATYAATAGDLAAGFLMFHVAQKPVDFVRANITVYTPVSGTPAVNILYKEGKV